MSHEKYTLSPRARADLEEIWLNTYKTWSLQQADIYLSEINSALEGLCSGTKIGRRVDIRDGYLKYAVRSHFVFYKILSSHIEVVRILHQRMDVNRHL